ncbi:MAG: hypothetical protein V3U79_03295 [Dehalococcoidia bacterium]
MPAAVTGVCQVMVHVIVPGPGMVLGTVDGIVTPPSPTTETTVTPSPRSRLDTEFRGRDLLGGAPVPVMFVMFRLADDIFSEMLRVAEAVMLTVPPTVWVAGLAVIVALAPSALLGRTK